MCISLSTCPKAMTSAPRSTRRHGVAANTDSICVCWICIHTNIYCCRSRHTLYAVHIDACLQGSGVLLLCRIDLSCPISCCLFCWLSLSLRLRYLPTISTYILHYLLVTLPTRACDVVQPGTARQQTVYNCVSCFVFPPGPDSLSFFCSHFALQPINYKFDHSYVIDAMKKHPGKVRSENSPAHPRLWYYCYCCRCLFHQITLRSSSQ